MILRRIGNKAKIANKIINHFPKHDLYIELFFGAGGMYFNKPKANYNFLNDLDSEIYNLFDVLLRHKDELINYIELAPYHTDFWEECKKRKPDNNIEKAVYFLTLSNYSYLGKGDTLHYKACNNKRITLKNIEKTFKIITENSNQFLNYDFRDVFKKISFKNEDKNKAFIYSDPPYLETSNNYNMEFKWTENDVIDCFDTTFNNGIRAAMSEFNHEFIIQQAKNRNLNIIEIGERINIKNKSTEILITNYETNQLTLF